MASLIERFVELSLTKPAQYGPENFAGDPIVQQYYELVLDLCQLDVDIYVSWECPPDVATVRSAAGNAVVRSERLDTLLVEYHHLHGLLRYLGDELADQVVRSAVLRWMCELLIGYRQPGLAVLALGRRPGVSGLTVHNPFRDETLASIAPLERAAIQCFCLGHEIGHLAREQEAEADLSTPVDGIAVMRHIDHDFRAEGRPDVEIAALRSFASERLDAPQLLTEIRADLLAFDTVTEFLFRAFGCDLDTAVRCSLDAFEAQLFLYHIKELCRLLSLVATDRLDEDEFFELELVADLEAVARGRAVTRRAGIVWATLESQGPTKRPDFNSYVDRVDAMTISGAARRERIQNSMMACCMELLRDAVDRPPLPESELRNRITNTEGLGLELFHILIAFGCAGGIAEVIEDYLVSMAHTTHRSTEAVTPG